MSRSSVADGTKGLPEEAPFDAIIVSAGGPQVPEALKQQLAIGGRLVIPVGAIVHQTLLRVRRTGEDNFEEEDFGAVAFVPLIGAEGWVEPGARSERPRSTRKPPASPMGCSCRRKRADSSVTNASAS